MAAAPPVAVDRLAARLDVSAGELAGYGRRGQTRTDHLRGVDAHTLDLTALPAERRGS